MRAVFSASRELRFTGDGAEAAERVLPHRLGVVGGAEVYPGVFTTPMRITASVVMQRKS